MILLIHQQKLGEKHLAYAEDVSFYIIQFIHQLYPEILVSLRNCEEKEFPHLRIQACVSAKALVKPLLDFFQDHLTLLLLPPTIYSAPRSSHLQLKNALHCMNSS